MAVMALQVQDRLIIVSVAVAALVQDQVLTVDRRQIQIEVQV